MADGAHDLAAATSMGSMADGAAVTSSVAAPVISTTMTDVLGDLKRRRQELKASLKDVSKTLKSGKQKAEETHRQSWAIEQRGLVFLMARQTQASV